MLQGLDLQEVTAVLSCAVGYVGNDSGITHLAGMMNVATVGVFGDSKPLHWRPLGKYSGYCQAADRGDGNWPIVDDVLTKICGLIDSENQKVR